MITPNPDPQFPSDPDTQDQTPPDQTSVVESVPPPHTRLTVGAVVFGIPIEIINTEPSPSEANSSDESES